MLEGLRQHRSQGTRTPTKEWGTDIKAALARITKSPRTILIISQAFGQLSLVAAMPFITRQIGPAAYGNYQIAFSIGIVVQPFITLRLDSLIPSEPSDHTVHRYLSLVWRVASIVAAMWIAAMLVSWFLEFDSLAITMLMAGVIAASYAVTAIDSSKLIRSKLTKRLAARNLLSGTLVGLLQIAFAIVFQNVILVAVALLLGRFVSIGLTRDRTPAVRSEDESDRPFQMDWGRTGFRIVGDLASSLSTNSMVLYSHAAFDSAATAFVGTAQRSASAPLGLISQALSQSVQADIGGAVRSNEQHLLGHVHKQMRSLLPYALMTSIGLMVLGPIAAEPVFGKGWQTTGYIIAMLGIPSGLQLLIAPVSVVFIMVGAERIWASIQFVRLFLSLSLALAAQVIWDDFLFAIAGFSVGLSVSYIFMYCMLRYVIHQRSLAPDSSKNDGKVNIE